MTNYIAVGDLHGCLDELKNLIDMIDLEKVENAQYIFLGDYIDRGPNSKGVIDYLIQFSKERDCVFLRGNHEDMMFDAYRDPGHLYHWQCNGGLQTEESYGGMPVSDRHLRFLNNARLYYDTQKYFFVHAGVHPTTRIEDQDKDDFLWIRKTFLFHRDPYEINKVVVHGHTVENLHYPVIRKNRINLDNGAVFGGHLSGIILYENGDQKVVSVKSKFDFNSM